MYALFSVCVPTKKNQQEKVVFETQGSTRRRRATAYDRGQHELICDALKVSADPDAAGPTAYEAVCVLMAKLSLAKAELSVVGGQKAVLKVLNQSHDKFTLIPCY